MKIKPEHVEHMYAAMRDVLANLPAEHVAEFRAAHSEKRFRWDLARGAGLILYMCDTIHPYADSTHIDTALRHIVKRLDSGE